jgi:hypothetical protein
VPQRAVNLTANMPQVVVMTISPSVTIAGWRAARRMTSI